MKVVTMVGPPTQMAECRGSILESAGIGAGAVQAASGSVITAAEIERKLSDRGKHGYDSDEDVEGGTWEHRKRAAEMKKTADEAARLTAAGQRRHHISHYLPKDVLENHLEQANATWEGREADYSGACQPRACTCGGRWGGGERKSCCDHYLTAVAPLSAATPLRCFATRHVLLQSTKSIN